MAKKYRSRSSSIIGDTVTIASRLPWWGALLFGIASFTLFYFAIPYWLEMKLAATDTSRIQHAAEALVGRRVHWFGWVGIACGLAGLFFAIRNYFVHKRAGREERGIVATLSRMLGRSLD